jgi:hypothetical protein
LVPGISGNMCVFMCISNTYMVIYQSVIYILYIYYNYILCRYLFGYIRYADGNTESFFKRKSNGTLLAISLTENP